ncbi:molybdopterin molybdotransferase MoeA [Prolixibacteraceae bacterium Z1-6]|uniref:Molybdopterin molybdenumtransferase n=1 Tax=Draconibacterium aestuarii TaxID=2998507 RepID=A0A9X3FA75_9BACT|nr:molybdopterin molybdotransferase MoeA [Prolixibacteraceae bacterium Z1-6]
MSKFNEIQKLIAQLPADFKTEEVALENAYNRILQKDVLADMDMPPFNKSAMDGYACHLEDIGNKLEVLEVLQAGMMPTKKVGKNQCSKIMTGAAVPAACDCVFKIEDSENYGKNHVVCINPKTAKNICYQGEDYQTGDVLLKKGTLVNVSQIAVLAGAGYTKVKVSVMPKITVIATGSELVDPHKKPQPGQIRNSNASQLITQLRKMNVEVTEDKLVSDDYEKLTHVFIQALKDNDIVFFTGGASFGDFDFIPGILKKQEFNVFWETTGMKPGNPMSFSQKNNKYCFGLSGNPVSSLIQFEFLAKPLIYKLLGANYTPLRIKAKMGFDYFRKKADRFGVVPVIIGNEGDIEAIPFHGSAHINALTFANALLEVPLEETNINKGEMAYVRPL